MLSKCGLYSFTAIIAGYAFYHDLPLLGFVDGVVIYVKSIFRQIHINANNNGIENIWL